MTREKFEKFIYGAYGVKADYPWLDKPNFGVFRHVIGRKWFALVMDLTMDKFGGDKNENVDVVNLKCVPSLIDSFCLDKGVSNPATTSIISPFLFGTRSFAIRAP